MQYNVGDIAKGAKNKKLLFAAARKEVFTLKRFLHKAALIIIAAAMPIQPAAAEKAQVSVGAALKKKLSTPPANFSSAGDIYTGALKHRESVRVPLPINTAGCYRVAVAADKSAEDISLVIYQSDVEKARDRLSGKHPVVDWCASEGKNVEAEVLMFTGHGAFALATFVRDTYKPTAAETKVGGDGNDLIANRIRQLKPQFAKNKKSASEVLRGNLKKGDKHVFPAQLKKSCNTIIVGQEPSLLKLDIRLADKKGNELPVRVRATSSFTILETVPCLPPGGEYRVIVQAAQGAGRFGFQIFSE
jgi:hypothetical protein